jgi:hypothetical protein
MTQAEASRRKAADSAPRTERSRPKSTPPSDPPGRATTAPPPSNPEEEHAKPDPSFQDDAQVDDSSSGGQGVFPYD